MHPKSYYQKHKAPRVHVQVWVEANGPVPSGYVIEPQSKQTGKSILSEGLCWTPAVSQCVRGVNFMVNLRGISDE